MSNQFERSGEGRTAASPPRDTRHANRRGVIALRMRRRLLPHRGAKERIEERFSAIAAASAPRDRSHLTSGELATAAARLFLGAFDLSET
jgi:hypothetical protein